MTERTFIVNGNRRRVKVAPGAVLLDVLREDLELTGVKDSCRRGECGSCTVLVDGRTVLSCVTLAELVDGPLETVEGLAAETRAFREAMADRGGFQCSYCTPGMVVRAAFLLRAGLPEDDVALASALGGNLCRCTGYRPILAALREAAS